LDCQNLHSVLKISCLGCLGIYPAISAQFTLEMCVAARNREKFTKTSYFGGTRSFKVSMLTCLRISSQVLVMISSMSVLTCNHYHDRQANKGKITFLRRCPSFTPSFHGNPLTQRYEILSQNTRDFRLSYGKNPKSLSHIASKRYRVVTDRQTDRQTELP